MKRYDSILNKRILRYLPVWAMLIFLTPVSLLSQGIPSLFVVADFMKVEPENPADYLEMEQEIWKPMQAERVSQGIIVGWYLYAVEFSGSDDEYNFVAITLYDNAENLENPWASDIPGKVHPGMTVDEIMDRTYAAREHVKSELFYSIATAPEIPLDRPAAYMQANFMKVEPGLQAEYEQMETEIWLPIHNESIKSGRTNGWSLWTSLFPRGSERPYQYITLNTFQEYSHIFDLDFSIPFNSIHPDKDYAEIQESARELRKIVRTELWDLIDYVIR